jgi:hypothetical protein
MVAKFQQVQGHCLAVVLIPQQREFLIQLEFVDADSPQRGELCAKKTNVVAFRR